MTRDNIMADKRGTYIEYVPNKTKDENPNIVKVYLTDRARAILDKYKNYSSTRLFRSLHSRTTTMISRQCSIKPE